MHLIVFPFIIYSALSVPVLLIWPGKGLSSRNYWLTVGPAMLGVVLGYCLALLIDTGLHPILLFYLMLVVVPGILASLAIMWFGNEGFFLTQKASVLYRSTGFTLLSGVGSTVAGGIIAYFFAFSFLTGNHEWLLMAVGVIYPPSLFAVLAASAFIKNATIKQAVKAGSLAGAVTFVFSLPLGLAFFLGLPVVLYIAIAFFLHLVILSLPGSPQKA